VSYWPFSRRWYPSESGFRELGRGGQTSVRVSEGLLPGRDVSAVLYCAPSVLIRTDWYQSVLSRFQFFWADLTISD
jgi:hypothetical protein